MTPALGISPGPTLAFNPNPGGGKEKRWVPGAWSGGWRGQGQSALLLAFPAALFPLTPEAWASVLKGLQGPTTLPAASGTRFPNCSPSPPSQAQG